MKTFKLTVRDKYDEKSKFNPIIIYADNLEMAIQRFRSHYCYELSDNTEDIEITAIREVKHEF